MTSFVHDGSGDTARVFYGGSSAFWTRMCSMARPASAEERRRTGLIGIRVGYFV